MTHWITGSHQPQEETDKPGHKQYKPRKPKERLPQPSLEADNAHAPTLAILAQVLAANHAQRERLIAELHHQDPQQTARLLGALEHIIQTPPNPQLSTGIPPQHQSD